MAIRLRPTARTTPVHQGFTITASENTEPIDLDDLFSKVSRTNENSALAIQVINNNDRVRAEEAYKQLTEEIYRIISGKINDPEVKKHITKIVSSSLNKYNIGLISTEYFSKVINKDITNRITDYYMNDVVEMEEADLSAINEHISEIITDILSEYPLTIKTENFSTIVKPRIVGRIISYIDNTFKDDNINHLEIRDNILKIIDNTITEYFENNLNIDVTTLNTLYFSDVVKADITRQIADYLNEIIDDEELKGNIIPQLFFNVLDDGQPNIEITGDIEKTVKANKLLEIYNRIYDNLSEENNVQVGGLAIDGSRNLKVSMTTQDFQQYLLKDEKSTSGYTEPGTRRPLIIWTDATPDGTPITGSDPLSLLDQIDLIKETLRTISGGTDDGSSLPDFPVEPGEYILQGRLKADGTYAKSWIDKYSLGISTIDVDDEINPYDRYYPLSYYPSVPETEEYLLFEDTTNAYLGNSAEQILIYNPDGDYRLYNIVLQGLEYQWSDDFPGTRRLDGSGYNIGSSSINGNTGYIPTRLSDLTNDVGYITEHQSLAGYATESYVNNAIASITHTDSIPTKVSDLENDLSYMTLQDMNDYVTKNYLNDELDNLPIPVNVSELVNDRGYLTEHQSLANYALKTYVDSAVANVHIPSSTSELTNDSGFLTEHQSLANYALKVELPTNLTDLNNNAGFITSQALNGYATENYVNTVFGNIVFPTKVSDLRNDLGYITEHQSLSGYATETYVDNAVNSIIIPTNITAFVNDAGYLTSHQSLAGYATEAYVNLQVSTLLGTGEVAEAFDTFKEIADYLSAHGQEYANLVTAVNGKADASSLATVATSGNYNDLSNKPSIPTVPTNVSAFTNDAGYLTSHQSLSGYATENYVTTAISNISIPSKISDLENDSSFLTEHQSLENYALKSEIPTVPTNVGEFINDVGYLTEHQSLANYALKSELPSVPTRVSDLTNDTGFITSEDLVDYALSADIPTRISDLENDSSFLTEHQSLDNYALKSEIPTKVSDLTNDANFITASSLPSNVSDLNNDTGFITSEDLVDYALSSSLPTKVSDLTNDTGFITSDALTPYALASALPTKVSDLTNDSGYLTQHQSLADYARLDTAQIFTADQRFNTGIKLGNVNGSVKLYQDGSGFFKIAFGDTDAFKIGPELVWPSVTATVDLGGSNNRFKDIYLSGGIKDGTHTFTLPSTTGTLALTTDIPTVPTNISTFTNDSGYITSSALTGLATETYVTQQINALLGTGEISEAFDTFKEISDYLTQHGSDYADLVTAVNGKADATDIPTVVSDLTNDAGYITKSVNDLTNYTLTSSLATVATSGSYNDLIDKPTIPTAVSSLTNDANYLSAVTNTDNNLSITNNSVINLAKRIRVADTTATSGNFNITSVARLNDNGNSSYAVVQSNARSDTADAGRVKTTEISLDNETILLQNVDSHPTSDYIKSTGIKIENNTITVYDKLESVNNEPSEYDHTYNLITALGAAASAVQPGSLATVATSGSYNDLTNKPTLFSGSYVDLTNKPTIPADTGDLTNNAGFITATAIANIEKTPLVETTPSNNAITIDPFKVYDFGTLSAGVTITLGTTGKVTGYCTEYTFRFTAASGCAITLPASCKFSNGNNISTFVTGHVYEYNIVDDLVAIGEFY